MIFTGSYKDFKNSGYKTCSISGDKGKTENYVGDYCFNLTPKKSFWTNWHENIGYIDELENNKMYIKEFYKQVLKNLDPEEIYKKYDGSIFLCYENSYEFCHRHIVAAWLELMLDIEVPEITLIDGKIVENKRPSYIKENLITVIEKLTDMKGFSSIRAAYLYEKREALEKEALKIEVKTGTIPENYQNMYNELTLEIENAELRYKEENYQKRKEGLYV